MSQEIRKIKIVEIYLEDFDGRGENFLTLVGANGEKYQAETEIHGDRADVKYLRLQD